MRRTKKSTTAKAPKPKPAQKSVAKKIHQHTGDGVITEPAAPQVTLTYLDRPPPGWFVLDVMRAGARKRNWVALMIDVHPDDLKTYKSKTAFLYIHPDEYRPLANRTAREAWVRIPGEHKTRDEAWDALEDAGATRH